VPPPAATSRSFPARIGAYRWLLGLALAVFVADQLTKAWVVATLDLDPVPPFGRITVVDGFFYLVHVVNTGAAWSLFADKSNWLAVLAVVTLVAIFTFRHHLELRRRPVQVSFGLLCGGIVGNLVDRIAHGHVIDFLLFVFGSYEFPVFNVADTAICVGVGLYLLYSFRAPKPRAGDETHVPPPIVE
jgi:signal peptidase II